MNAPAQVKLRDCVSLSKGKPPAQQPYYGTDSEWYLTPEYLRGAAACDRAKPGANAVRVHDGDTILLWDGSNAGEVFRGRGGMLASTMTLVSPDKRFASHYFYFALKQWEAYLKGQTSGSGIPHVDKEVLGKLEITEFTEPEQSKIAEVLSTVDRAIAQTEALIAKQQRIKTGLMQDLLTRGIDEHGQLRSEATHAFKDSPLGRIPVEWEIRTLSQVTHDVVDCPHTTPHFKYDGVLVVRTFNLKDSEFVGERSYVTDGEYTSRISRLKPCAGDVVITREAPVGEAFVIPSGLRLCLGQRTMLVRCNTESCLPEFLVELIYFEQMQMRFDRMVGGTTNPHLNVKDVRSLSLALPSIGEQEIALSALLGIRTLQQDQSKILAKLRSLKTALMQDLLTGKVRVTPLLQPAEEATP